MNIEQLTGSKLGEDYDKAMYCHPAYLTYMQRPSCKTLCWMNHKLESRLLGEQPQICGWYHSNGRKQRKSRKLLVQFSSFQSFSRVRLFATPWIPARQASLSITSSQSSLRLISVEPVMPSSHLILCRPLLLLPPVPRSIRVFSNESTLCMRWPKYWSFSISIVPSKEHPFLRDVQIAT